MCKNMRVKVDREHELSLERQCDVTLIECENSISHDVPAMFADTH